MQEYYGNEVSEMPKSSGNKNQTTISYSTKAVQEEVPAGARVNKTETNIAVEEIENGWLKTVNVYIMYSIKENDGDWEDKYCYHTKKYFSKTKPIDIEMSYGI